MPHLASPRLFLSLVSLLLIFLVSFCAPAPISTPPFPPTPKPTPLNPTLAPNYRARVGWAYEAYPDVSSEQMVAEMSLMRAAGANSIWIGHNNPGEVDANKVEPGLSFAVYYALLFESGKRRDDAQAMADAVKRAIQAARQVGLRVVLPIGYQIMMGATWNNAQPDALRKTFDGKILQLFGSPPTASPYSSQYRADITRYYQWIQTNWVEPSADTVEMLSLADEPLGGDYSGSAQTEFEKRYGKRMSALAPEEQWKIGEFESGVIVDYATWSANVWRDLNPQMPVTISFDGGVGRHNPGMPEIEKIFSQTPGNFVVTFDAYLHDDLPNKPVLEAEIAELKLFLTTLGHYSKIYHKPLALWAGVNSWGLAQQSTSPRDVIDAIDNIFLLMDLPARVGGDLRGVYAWNYNVKGQGIYNYNGPTTYDPALMAAAVNRLFMPLRTRLTNPQVQSLQAAVVVSPREMYDSIGLNHSADLPPEWFDIQTLATLIQDQATAIVTPGQSLDAASNANLFIYAGTAKYLDARMSTFLKERVSEGKIVMVSSEVADAWPTVPQELWLAGWKQIPTTGGVVYMITQPGVAK